MALSNFQNGTSVCPLAKKLYLLCIPDSPDLTIIALNLVTFISEFGSFRMEGYA